MLSTRKLIAIGAVLAVSASGIAIAQTMPEHHAMGSDHMQQMAQTGQHPMGPDHMQEMMRRHQGTMPMGAHDGMHAASTTPTMPGQDAFGAIQEIVQILDADPKTDWSKVDLEGLRQHLIDMNDVTLKAEAAATPIEGGVAITITGTGRTVAAIQRMVPAHAQEVEHTHLNGWSAKTETLPNGVTLTVTASDPKEVAHIRGLGFIGILASGTHHQPHHLAMARGEMSHAH